MNSLAVHQSYSSFGNDTFADRLSSFSRPPPSPRKVAERAARESSDTTRAASFTSREQRKYDIWRLRLVADEKRDRRKIQAYQRLRAYPTSPEALAHLERKQRELASREFTSKEPNLRGRLIRTQTPYPILEEEEDEDTSYLPRKVKHHGKLLGTCRRVYRRLGGPRLHLRHPTRFEKRHGRKGSRHYGRKQSVIYDER
ncbi:hypothetical protein BT93_L4512 [Corymbia citriodora subsp. variegata]|uniref:Uncharacterized protein n=1 Tax=Corymbia citriodora subsp. variegata TaxID=360336 RepID=A0A8T0CFQ8_CORYI|nr:hypothetical protein BT93_L4512 [Corymbia citriodora subsp. variegata]